MIAIIFESRPHPDQRDRYLDAAARLKPLLADIDGFISVERFESLYEEASQASLQGAGRDTFEALEFLQLWRHALGGGMEGVQVRLFAGDHKATSGTFHFTQPGGDVG